MRIMLNLHNSVYVRACTTFVKEMFIKGTNLSGIIFFSKISPNELNRMFYNVTRWGSQAKHIGIGREATKLTKPNLQQLHWLFCKMTEVLCYCMPLKFSTSSGHLIKTFRKKTNTKLCNKSVMPKGANDYRKNKVWSLVQNNLWLSFNLGWQVIFHSNFNGNGYYHTFIAFTL